jgi:hypothetical protein
MELVGLEVGRDAEVGRTGPPVVPVVGGEDEVSGREEAALVEGGGGGHFSHSLIFSQYLERKKKTEKGGGAGKGENTGAEPDDHVTRHVSGLNGHAAPPRSLSLPSLPPPSR